MQSDSKQYYTVIRPHAPLLQLDLKELFKYKDLILILARKDFSQRYRQTILGPIWALLSPLLTSLTHLFFSISVPTTSGPCSPPASGTILTLSFQIPTCSARSISPDCPFLPQAHWSSCTAGASRHSS